MIDTLELAVLALALTGCSLLAYSLRILDARGSLASFALGAIILWSGGIPWFLLMVAFTGIAFVATRFGRRRKERQGTAEAREGERGAPNVIANGAAPAGVALVAMFFDPAAAEMAYVVAVAAIMADTLASEIGGLSPRARRIIPPFPRRDPGTNGAVSLLGQLAAAAGPAAIGVIAIPLLGLSWSFLPIPIIAGFMGSQVDSILGATLEKDALRPNRPLGKGSVNFIAAAIPAALVLLAIHFSATV